MAKKIINILVFTFLVALVALFIPLNHYFSYRYDVKSKDNINVNLTMECHYKTNTINLIFEGNNNAEKSPMHTAEWYINNLAKDFTSEQFNKIGRSGVRSFVVFNEPDEMYSGYTVITVN